MWGWSSCGPGPVPASPVPAAFLPRRHPPPNQARCRCLPLPACAPLPGSSTPPAACSGLCPWDRELWLKIPYFLCLGCARCVSLSRVCVRMLGGCAGMNLGRGAYFSQKTLLCFFIPLSPPPLHTLYLKLGKAGDWSTLNHRFIAASSFWKLSLEKEE